MSTLEHIEAAIPQLPPEEFQKPLDWFLELDYERWDEQLEKDVSEGQLDKLAEEAIAEFETSYHVAT